MDNNAPAAPAEAPKAPESEATPTPTTNSEPVQAPDMHGFTSEELADIRTFLDSNGGFSKVKSRISNPQSQPVEKPVENLQPQANDPTSRTQAQPVESRIPEGALSQRDVDIKRYFKDLSEEPAYANISKEIANGDYLREMTDLGIQIEVAPGFYNDDRIRKYLNIKSQTVPAKPTDTTPDASAAPTVTYTEVGEGGIKNIEEAYKIMMEPGSPHRAKAEEFIRNVYNKK